MINLHEVPELKRIDVDGVTYIRPLQTSDAEAVLAILGADSSIREHVTAAARMNDEAGVEKEVASYQSMPDLVRYVIIHNREIVGLISLWADGGYFDTAPIENGYGFGYFLAPNARGKGIISKTIEKLMDVVSSKLHVDVYMAYCEDGNESSVRLLTRLGFHPTSETFAEPKHGWTERRYIKSS